MMRSRLWSAATLRLAAVAAVAVVALVAIPGSVSAASGKTARPGASTTEKPVQANSSVNPNFSTDCTLTSIGSGVNVRSGPSTSFGVVGSLSQGQTVTSPGCGLVHTPSVTTCGFTENIWREFIFQGQVRWATDDCLSP